MPVDIFPAEQLAQQGSTETSIILQAVSPSINFPRQSVTDAGDIVRPFTLRGLSPDHTLVLVNGWRRHQTALVNNFTYGMGAGSSGVDLNAIPSSALDRIEVLRDGAAAQYGSDAIAGVVNLVLKDGAFTPFVNGDVGRYVVGRLSGRRHHRERERRLGHPDRPRLARPLRRVPRPPADQPGLGRPVRDRGHRRRRLASTTSARSSTRTTRCRSPTTTGATGWRRTRWPWPTSGCRSTRRAAARSTPSAATATGTASAIPTGATSTAAATGSRSIRSASCRRSSGLVTDYSAAGGLRGLVSGWNYDARRRVRPQRLRLRDRQHAATRRWVPASTWPARPGADGILGNVGRSRAFPNQLSFFAGRVLREELVTALNIAKPVELGLPKPGQPRLRRGVPARALRDPRRASSASYINGGATGSERHRDPAPAGSQSFPGFAPSDATDRHRTNFGLYADAETNLSEKVLAERGRAVRGLQRLRLAGERQGARSATSRRAG